MRILCLYININQHISDFAGANNIKFFIRKIGGKNSRRDFFCLLFWFEGSLRTISTGTDKTRHFCKIIAFTWEFIQ